jgi:hypothetical protein
MELENPIEEARRYVANAEEIIKNSKLDPETNLYRDKKYVRIAGDTLWKGCLIALDAVLGVRTGKGRPSIAKYQEAAGNATANSCSLSIPVTKPCTCTWGTMAIKARRCAMPGSIMPTPSLTVANCCTRITPLLRWPNHLFLS